MDLLYVLLKKKNLVLQLLMQFLGEVFLLLQQNYL